ncbi:MAG: tetratricopeptide repeat protein [Chthoniobacterales bacterium]
MSSETPLLSPPLFEIFWEQHRQKIIGATFIAVFLVFVLAGLLFWKRSERLAADHLLSSAHGMEEWQRVVDRYPHSGAAANALLLIAGAQAQEHHLEESQKTYVHFLKRFSHYPLAISARLGMGMNEDVMGHADRAAQEFQQAVTAYPTAYAAPEALLLEARIMARLGKKEEVKRVLQLIATQYPDSLVSTMVLKQGKGSL